MIDEPMEIADVEKAIGLSRSSIYRGMRAGWFPQAVKTLGGRWVWERQDVLDWINREALGRDRFDNLLG